MTAQTNYRTFCRPDWKWDVICNGEVVATFLTKQACQLRIKLLRQGVKF